jgi:hypothetical protein
MQRRGVLTLVVALLLAWPATLWAAGTITQSYVAVGNIRKVVFTCTADAAAATFPATVLTGKIEGRLIAIETDPGSTAPTDNYDIAITDALGLDVLQGAGQNRDTVTTESAAIVFASTSVNPVVDESDTLTLAITNNAVNSATITIVLYYATGY